MKVFAQDFITLNPYLGSDSITPFFLKDCEAYEKGLFVLARLLILIVVKFRIFVDGTPIYEKVGALIEKWGESTIGQYGFSYCGCQ